MFRGFFGTLALLLVVAAAMLGLLRLAVVNLETLESWINEKLEDSRISLVGLRGSWSGVTPTVSMDRLVIGDSSFDGVVATFDVFESLLRSVPIAQFIQVESGDFIVVHQESGWGVEGGLDAGPFDLMSLFWHSDRLDMRFRAHLIREESSVAGEIHITSSNRGGRHRHEVSFRPLLGCGSCDGSAIIDVSKGRFWGGELSGSFEASLGRVDFDLGLVGLGSNEFASLTGSAEAALTDGRWTWKSDLSVGSTFPEEVKGLEFGVHGSSEDSVHSGRATFKMVGAESEHLPTLQFELTDLQALLWSRDVLKLEVLLDHAEPLRSTMPEVLQWLEETAPRGEIHSFAIFSDEEGRIAHLRLKGLETRPARGLPGVEAETIDLYAVGNALFVVLGGAPTRLHLPEHFEEELAFDSVQGTAGLVVGADFLGFRSSSFRASSESVTLSGSFGFRRSLSKNDYQSVLSGSSEVLSVEAGEPFLSTTIPTGLREWLLDSVLEGALTRPAMLMFISKMGDDETSRVSLDFRSGLSEVTVDYADGWPALEHATGQLLLTNQGFTASAATTSAAGVGLSQLVVSLPPHNNHLQVEGFAELDLKRALELVWETPIQELTDAISQTWVGSGPTNLEATLVLDLDDEAEIVDLDVALSVDKSTFEMPEHNLRFTDLEGTLHISYPFAVSVERMRGRFFDKPAVIDLETELAGSEHSQSDKLLATVQGEFEPSDVWEYLELEDPELATGRSRFHATVEVPSGESSPALINLESNLVGTALDLPSPYTKGEAESLDLGVRITALGEHAMVEVEASDVFGWLELQDGEVMRGSVGIGVTPVLLPAGQAEIVISGRIDEFELTADDTEDLDAELPVRLTNFEVGRIDLGSFELTDVVVNGLIANSGSELGVQSTELDAVVVAEPETPVRLEQAHLRIWADEEEEEDPLTLEIMDEVVSMSAELLSTTVFEPDGSEFDYGSWSFTLAPDEEGILVEHLTGEITGMSITADRPMRWSRADNRTSIAGHITGEQLSDVLQAWGYDLNVETEEFAFTGDVHWSGSPLAFDPEALSGSVQIELTNGQMLDVERVNSSVRISSLMNFTSFFRRLGGDFPALSSEGLGFFRINAAMSMEDGLVELKEPGYFDGTGVSMAALGTVHLESEEIDMALVITLGLDKSIHWYTTYLLLANPIAGAGVFLGKQIFGEALKNLLSGLYRVTGTVDEPEVELVRAFSDELKPDSEEEEEPFADDSPGE